MTDLLSVEPLPAPLVRWFEAFRSDEDSVQACVVESDGYREVLQLSLDDEDGTSEHSAGRIYTDSEGRHLYIWPTEPPEDEKLYATKDYLDSNARVARHRAHWRSPSSLSSISRSNS